jgi:hypothetical protein
MNTHEATLMIVCGLIDSFYERYLRFPLIGDIQDALNHQEMSKYSIYFRKLTEQYSRDHPIRNISEGFLEIEAIPNTPTH